MTNPDEQQEREAQNPRGRWLLGDLATDVDAGFTGSRFPVYESKVEAELTRLRTIEEAAQRVVDALEQQATAERWGTQEAVASWLTTLASRLRQALERSE